VELNMKRAAAGLTLIGSSLLCLAAAAQPPRRGQPARQPQPSTQQRPAAREPRQVTAIMRNGDRVSGVFVGATAEAVTLSVGGSRLTLDTAEIALLDFSGGKALAAAQQPAQNEALVAVQKLKSAVDVGVLFERYGELLIDARAAADRALPSMPEGEAKSELSAAVEAYGDAFQGWDEIRRRGGRYETLGVYADSLSGRLQKKYDIPMDNIRTADNPLHVMTRNAILTPIWRRAARHVERAAELMK
jgi:hypothetical protein